METSAGFDVVVSSGGSTSEEWRRALTAAPSELSALPALDAWQQQWMRRFGVTEEEYKRGRLAVQYARERIRERGIQLGTAIQEILSDLGGEYRLKAIIDELNVRDRWVARIPTPQKIVNVAVERELADALIDSNTIQDQEQLRTLLQSSLRRGEPIGKGGR